MTCQITKPAAVFLFALGMITFASVASAASGPVDRSAQLGTTYSSGGQIETPVYMEENLDGVE